MCSAASALGFPCDPISIYTLLFVDIAKISWTAFCWVFVSLSSLCVFTGSSATSCHTINTTPFTKHCDMKQTSPTKSQVLRPHCLNPWPHGVIMCSLDDAMSAYSLCRWQPMVCCLLLVWHGDVDDAVDRISNEVSRQNDEQPIFSPVEQNLLQGTSSCLKAEVLTKQYRWHRYQHWHWQLLWQTHDYCRCDLRTLTCSSCPSEEDGSYRQGTKITSKIECI